MLDHQQYRQLPNSSDLFGSMVLIALVAALLFPTFAQARTKARQFTCLSNIKQIGIATIMYAQDYDEVFPPCRVANPTYSKGAGHYAQGITFWSQELLPYLKNEQIFKCPTNPAPFVNADTTGNDEDPLYLGYGGQNSYGANAYLFRPDRGFPMAALMAPAQTVSMVDARYYLVLPRGPGGAPCRLAGEPKTQSLTALDPTIGTNAKYWKNIGSSYLFRFQKGEPEDAVAEQLGMQSHLGFINTVFTDGHARAVSYRLLVEDSGLREASSSSMWDPYQEGCK